MPLHSFQKCSSLKKTLAFAGIALLLIVGWFLWRLFGPNPAIVVSKDTTFITAPLRPNGLPDYEKYLLEKMREGVTPENNAAVLFWQAMGPGEMSAKEFELVAKEIGLEKIPTPEECLKALKGEENRNRVVTWLREQYGDEVLERTTWTNADNLATDLIDQAMERPWSSEQIPPLVEWVQENEKPLDLLVAASQRPNFYSPPVEFLNDESELLLEMSLSGVTASQTAAKALSARAMWHLGEGRHTTAWADIHALYRLSRLIDESNTLIEELVSIAIERIANDTTLALLNADDLPAELARSIHRELNEIPSRLAIGKILYEGERLFAIDSVLSLQHPEDIDFSNTDGPEVQMFSIATTTSNDWNVCLNQINEWYNDFAPIVGPHHWKDRNAGLEQHRNRSERLESSSKNSGHRVILGAFSRKVRAGLFSDFFAALLIPAASAALSAEDRANTELTLTQIAAAIALYRAEHGEYPDKLDALVPDILDELPRDLFHNNPFAYRRTKNGFLLYSLGPDGDDDGSNGLIRRYNGYSTEELPTETLQKLLDDELPVEFDPSDEFDSLDSHIPADADDIAIRVPLPKLELPKRAEPKAN